MHCKYSQDWLLTTNNPDPDPGSCTSGWKYVKHDRTLTSTIQNRKNVTKIPQSKVLDDTCTATVLRSEKNRR
jgi:hypothetical protein